jgi:hypothetical protein
MIAIPDYDDNQLHNNQLDNDEEDKRWRLTTTNNDDGDNQQWRQTRTTMSNAIWMSLTELQANPWIPL